MKTYISNQIEEINEQYIKFIDGRIVLFSDCVKNWSNKHGIINFNSACVGERNSQEVRPYYIFWGNINVKVVFKSRGLFINARQLRRFNEFQVKLNKLGYTTYDLS